MKNYILLLIVLFLTTNSFAQNAFTSSFNTKSKRITKSNSINKKVATGVKSDSPHRDTDYSETVIGINQSSISSNDTEYEYDDGTVEGRIEDTYKKRKDKNKLATNLVETPLDKKSTNGYNAPSSFFDLSDWSLSVPEDKDGNQRADHIKEKELSGGYMSNYFYATDTGAMVLTCPINGFKTSANTTYTRVELREMLRAGNTSIKTKGPTKNNWVLKSSKSSKSAGGYNGELKATLAVNHVTTTGYSSQVGRVVIGQIHAKHNEPMRLYYRKLPNNKKGSIYFVHEKTKGKNKKEDYYELIGTKSSSAKNPNDGIELNEKFSYQVSLIKNKLTVTIFRPFKSTVQKVINIKKSGYNNRDEYLYFKAGVYNQNKSGDPKDYVQATFYELSNTHQGGF